MAEPDKDKGPDRTRAHVMPFAVFLGFLFLLQATGYGFEWDHPVAPWWRRWPEHWVYPLQSITCIVLLIRWWRRYEFAWTPRAILLGSLFGAVGIGFWLLPTTLYDRLGVASWGDGWWQWLGVEARTDGFDPGVFGNPAAYWATLVARFFRAVVVVALVEEIFWRGFLMRFVLDWEGNYWKQPFGKASWLSYAVTTGAFMMAHAPVDYAGALVYGSLTYLLCVWSKSLSACVVMHAVANLLMGCYAVAYGKFGLW